MTSIAAEAPVHGLHIPGWATPHNLALIAGAAVVAIVVIGLVRAVGRLSKLVKPPPAPAPGSSGKGTAFLVAAAAAAGGWMLWKHGNAPAAKAAPAPAPAPQPTVTTTVTPHPVTHFVMPHLSGGVVIGIFVIGAVVAIVLLGPVLRRSS